MAREFCCNELRGLASLPDGWRGAWSAEVKVWLRVGSGEAPVYRCSGWHLPRFCPFCGQALEPDASASD